MPKFCANISLLYSEVALEQRVACAADGGFEAFEIQFPYELSARRWKQLMKPHAICNVLINVAADDLMTGGEGLACVPGKQAQFRRAVAQTQRYIEAMGSRVVNVLPGRCLNPLDRQAYWQVFIENLGYAVEQFSSMGVMTTFEAINTEDMPGFLVHSTDQMLQVVHQLNHPGVKMQYDLYHMARMRQNLLTDLRDHASLIGHIQFADTPGRGEPGSGSLSFSELFAQIDASDYQGWVGAEYRPTRATRDTLAWFRA